MNRHGEPTRCWRAWRNFWQAGRGSCVQISTPAAGMSRCARAQESASWIGEIAEKEPTYGARRREHLEASTGSGYRYRRARTGPGADRPSISSNFTLRQAGVRSGGLMSRSRSLFARMGEVVGQQCFRSG